MASKLKARPPAANKEGRIKMLVYGLPKVRKTWLALSFPRPFYFDTEHGARLPHYQARLKEFGGGYMGPQDGTLDFDVLIEQMKLLATTKHDYKTLVVDSITKIFQTKIALTTEAMEAAGKEIAFGNDKLAAVREMRKLVNWLTRLDMNVILVAHEIDRYGDNGKGGRDVIGVKPDAWAKLEYELDLCIHAVNRGPEFAAMVEYTRLLGFPKGEKFPLEYEEFAKRYGKDLIEGETKELVLAEPAQIEELSRLVELFKVAPEEIQKWLTKAQAESFAEMDTEVIQKCIEFVKAKLK